MSLTRSPAKSWSCSAIAERASATPARRHRNSETHRILGFVALLMLAVGIGSACSGLSPTPLSPSQSPSIVPLPSPECPTEPPQDREVLNCAAAVSAAAAILPAGASIAQVRFRYGDYCPHASACPATTFDRGFVIFSERTPVRGQVIDYYVVVVVDAAGRARVVDGPIPLEDE